MIHSTLWFLVVCFTTGCQQATRNALKNQLTPASSTLITPTTITPSSTATPTSLPAGPPLARILFNNKQTGSFQSATVSSRASDGTVEVTQYYDGTNSPLSTPPAWLSQASVTLSAQGKCANFTPTTETTSQNCNLATTANSNYTTSCAAPANQYRISEADCAGDSTPSLGIQVTFNRDPSVLGPAENILAILEYSANSISNPPISPASCLNNGVFSVEQCADFTWRVFLAPDSTTPTQPFLLLIPPLLTSVSAQGGLPAAPFSTRQWVIPLAQDSSLTFLQMRLTADQIQSQSGLLNKYCSSGSPFCSGIVFYTLTFIRI